MKHLGTKTLESERLVLRPFSKEDAPIMFANWAGDPEVTKYLIWPAHRSVADSEAIIGEWLSHYVEDDFYNWAIVLREENTLVGSIGVVDKNDDIAMVDIGYCIGQKWWRQGVTSEALGLVIRFLFTEVEINRIQARHDPRNPYSGWVMQKCGMKYEGILRQSGRSNMGISDFAMYAILAEDYE